MVKNEIRFKVNDLTYNTLKALSIKLGIPITKVVKNIVINRLVELHGGKK